MVLQLMKVVSHNCWYSTGCLERSTGENEPLNRERFDGLEYVFLRGHLYCVACVDHCIMVVILFLAPTFPPRELAIHKPLWHDACVRFRSCGGILFPLPQHAHELVSGVKTQHLVERARFNPVMLLLAKRLSN